MNLSIFRQQDSFPSFVADKLSSVSIDYKEKYQCIQFAGKIGTNRLGAGVVLLLNYKKNNHDQAEYFFQLIKRSDKVSQAGDISCPGGMLHPFTDKILSHLLATRIVSTMPDHLSNFIQSHDKETINLVHLFLTNALREAWEEIGLNPLRVLFLGALPCYSLILFTKTIFPLVCLVPEPLEFKLNAEVEKILEIPISTFFEGSNYAFLEIESPFGNSSPTYSNQYPCIVLTDDQGKQEILWGATFNIIMHFLRIISDNTLPLITSSKIIKKVLSQSYISGNSK